MANKKKGTKKNNNNSNQKQNPDNENKGVDKAQLLQIVIFFVVAAFVAVAAYYIAYRQVVPQKYLPPIIAGAILLLPVLMFVERFLEEEVSAAVKSFRIILSVTALLTSAFFIIAPYLDYHTVFVGEFAQIKKEVPIIFKGDGNKELVLEVEGNLSDVKAPYKVKYGFRIGDTKNHELLKGSFERVKGIINKGEKKGQTDWFNEQNVFHRFSQKIDKNGTLELYKLESSLEGESALPVKVRLRLEPASWFMFLLLILPLILLSGLADQITGANEKFPFLSSRATFMLLFTFIFSNTLAPGNIFKPILFSIIVALIFSFATSWLLPKILKPLLKIG